MWGSSRTMFCQNIVKIGLLTLLRKQRHWRPAANGMGSSRAAGGGLGRTEAAAACLPLYSAGASSPHLFDFFPLCLAFHVFPQSNWTSACIVTLVAFFSWKIGQCACLSLCPAGAGSSRTHTKGFTQKILQLVSAILGRSKESTCQNEEFHSSSYRSPWTQLGQLVLSPSGWNKVQHVMGGPITPFSGREERTRSLGRDTRRRAMSQARGSTRWFSLFLLSFNENTSCSFNPNQWHWWVENRNTAGQFAPESRCQPKSRSIH